MSNFCEDEFNLLSVAISALMPTKLAVDMLYCKETNLLIAGAVIQLMMVTLGNENSELAIELQLSLKLHISQRHTNLSQVIQCLHIRAQDDSELFPRLSKDTVVKIILCLIKCLFPSEKYLNLEDQHGTEHHSFADSFHNKKLCDSNEIESLNDRLESTIN
jgi:hypothetical protein